MNLKSSVGIPKDYVLGGRGLIVGRAKLFFSAPQRPERLWGPPLSYQMGTGCSFPGVKRQERESNNLPPSSAAIKNSRAIPPFPITSSWHRAQFIKQKDNFTCTQLVTRYTIQFYSIGCIKYPVCSKQKVGNSSPTSWLRCFYCS
jgi:hypothetical protein